jgi:hypothetical protein
MEDKKYVFVIPKHAPMIACWESYKGYSDGLWCYTLWIGKDGEHLNRKLLIPDWFYYQLGSDAFWNFILNATPEECERIELMSKLGGR